MRYEEFMHLRRAGKIRAGVNHSIALQLIQYLPKRYQAAHIFWSWVWVLTIPAFIYISIFIKWWIGLLLICFVTPTISSAIKKSAAEFVLEHVEENKAFFEKMVEKDLLMFVESNNDYQHKTY